MINLNTTHSLTQPGMAYQQAALPVLVDLNWFGRVMTQENAGIISRPISERSSDDDSLCL